MNLVVFLSVFALGLNSIVLAEIPEYYRLHDHYAGGSQVCTEDMAGVGPRAGIYCYGRILESVMAMGLYNDSKTFVDKPLKFPANEVRATFDKRFPVHENITKEALQIFIDENFGREETELEPCDLSDWTTMPPKLKAIKDPTLREFSYTLNNIWKRLCRQITPVVRENEELYSLILVPHKFVVPGGRFREFYYWDTLWIIKGLLASGMHDTTRDILLNFVHLVEKYGFIPNGGRIYYLSRSQPPMLASMFYEYLETTGDINFIQQHIKTLEKEYAFWNRRHVNLTIDGKIYKMYQYRAESDVPRPESFREDVELVKDRDWNEKGPVWTNLASAAESGFDFSSRWLRNFTDLSSIDTTSIVEVDLNAFMCKNMELMAHFYSLIDDPLDRESVFRSNHSRFTRDFQKVFFKGDGWYDYDLRNKRNNIDFYPSNVVPLFARCYDSLDRLKAEKVYKKMKDYGAFSYRNGIPTSLHETGEQWDLPNSWPPLEHMIIDGFRRSESAKLQELAYDIARKWINTNLEIFKKSKKMWEKLNVQAMKKGEGGEYENQAGFGWTNGAVLDLLVKYGGRLDAAELTTPSNIVRNSTQPQTSISFYGLVIPNDIILFIVFLMIIGSFASSFIFLR